MIFLYLTLLVFYRNGMQTFRKIFSDPTLFFCLVLTLIFAFAVGISSYNFGALSRYKIPCMPFFGAFLVILLYKGREEVLAKKITIRKRKQVLQPS
jgi:ABC-type sulfate transport system permease component